MSLVRRPPSRRAFIAAGSASALLSTRSVSGLVLPPRGLHAGAAIADISLPIGAINGGIIVRGGPITQVHDPLRVRCVVFHEGTTSMAIAVCDTRMIGRSIIEKARRLAASELKWPIECILISATHSHAAPGLIGIHSNELDRWYADNVALRIADAIRMAVANLAPAKIGFGSIDKPEHVFNRRWKVATGQAAPNPFGSSGDNVITNPTQKDSLIEPAGPVDPRMSLLSIQHTDGRPLALLANYGLHYVGGYQSNNASADYFGIFSERIVELLDASHQNQHPPMVAMMSNGASGDVNNSNREKLTGKKAPWEQMREVAYDLAESAVKTIQNIEHRDDQKLGVKTSTISSLNVRRPDANRLAWAREMLTTIGNAKQLSRPQIYAQEAFELEKYPEQISIELQGMRIGDVSIAAIPGEVFAESGLELARRSPFAKTFTIELANGYYGYLPPPRHHELGGYETWPARSSFLEVGATDKIQSSMLSLLDQLKG